ncbi:MAG: dihydropyrimidinase [Phycisphaerales bacterium]|nr:dihydropyrimidinase [Phycisphaerales bacterium]
MPRSKSARTVIRGGTIHTATHSFRGDVAIADGRIEAVGAALPVDAGVRVIEAAGMEVIPGCIDVHVHLALPFCGTVSCDDFESGSRAAACGGVTTLIDFAIPGSGQSLREAHDAWWAKSEGLSGVDYTWHMALTDRRHIAEVPAMIDMGLPTFKEFMIYESEGWNSDDAMMFATLEQVREHGGMLLVHAESSRVLDLLIERHHTPAQMRKYGARLHPMTRPNFVEAEAIERAIHWASATGGTLYIVHMSTAQGADLVRQARQRGVNVWAETCTQYLTLDDRVFDAEDGHLFACCPQVKKQSDIDRLWQALERGGEEVCVVSTDTCSFTREQKAMWWVESEPSRRGKSGEADGPGARREGYGDWTKIPMGLPGLETMAPLVYTLGVRPGRISMNRLVELCCTNPARIMGMGDRKGHIAPGFDADIVIIDPSWTKEVDWKEMHSRCDWSPYQGMKLGGFARTTLLRGQVIVDGYKYVGRRGQGQFIERHGPGSLAPA